MILRAQAQSLLLLAYGGQLSHDEMGFTEAQVGTWLCMARDSLLGKMLEARYDSFQPPAGLYTRYDKLPLAWDDGRRMYFVKLPNGNPPTVINGRGIRVEPVDGVGETYLHTPHRFIAMNPRYAYMEGNWAWEHFGDGKVWFTNMPAQPYQKYVALWVVETGPRDLDSESGIPGEMFQDCADIVLERMGLARVDTKTDGLDQRNMGGGGK
jgi:hypothetical protein